MSETSINLRLPLLAAAQAQKHITHNEALELLDAIVQLAVVEHGCNVPPERPEPGERYVIGPAPIGEWSGHEGAIASRGEHAWRLITPRPGWVAVSIEDGRQRLFRAGAWQEVAGGPGNNSSGSSVAALGIGAKADPANPLSVAAATTLLSHAGGSHRLAINKSRADETASLVFQNDFSGRAELALGSGNRLALRTSPDGKIWNDSLTLDTFTGLPALPHGANAGGVLNGTAIVGSIDSEGNGALFARGENSDGQWFRFRSGMQICQARLELVFRSASLLQCQWNFPKPFAGDTTTATCFTLADETAATPGPEDFAYVGGNDAGMQGRAAYLRIYRRNGGVDFAAEDRLVAHAIATGRFY